MYLGQQMTIKWLNGIQPKSISEQKTIWMHCSSLGEFEQGRMILEGLRQQLPDIYIYLSFFSPSGYEIRHNWVIANKVFYLPVDTEANASLIIGKLRPDCIILVKYDFWWNLLQKASDVKIPVYLVAANFNRDRYFFKPPFIHIMKKWKCIFTIRENTALLLNSYGFQHLLTVGDPRTDRVIAIKNQIKEFPKNLVKYLTSKPQVVVYGSVWESDLHVINPFIRQNPDILHILVPHDVSPENVHTLSKTLDQPFSLLSKEDYSSGILMVDKIGILSSLYNYATFVYIGGGFGKGIHNTLEAAVYEVPLFFGPRYTSFPEAIEFVEVGAGFVVHDGNEFINKTKHLLRHQEDYIMIGKKLHDYFIRHQGASQKIISHIIRENFTG